MKKGFTIIELVIVISVLTILIAITIPKLRGMQDQAFITKAKGELTTLQTAVESYNTFNSLYPSDINGSLVSAVPQILPSALTDPFSSGYAQIYQYYLSVSGKYYVIYSMGVCRTATITGVNNAGQLTGSKGCNICVTNGTGC